ncbi:DPBB and LysM peptidoglycan-binding domain-containing protein [Companilactobacillus keshanensis]|uniref:LysM peptidoglycan-binding domain-containing protein n=1 Tax=Companilactobacillus keshanensis TaxID=2486003 RepID=A0ABW4BTH8_9LACO|nr:LysM peptidoglycan-binding domain-containing protein [Companilactobacillus keshanensis]
MKKLLSVVLLSSVALTAIGVTSNTVDAATTVDSTHVKVESGDSYKSIAEANGVSISALEQANNKDVGGFDLIFPGETITLPSATSNTATTDTTTQAATDTTAAANTNTQATTDTATTQSATTQASTDTTASAQSSTSTATTGTSQGTFKISFYDPAVLGSNMGYSGVAANLSVFPKGTQLKITLSDGTVMYRTVNDTGTFANTNSQQLDVAMPSSSIPSYGVTTATVEIV